MGRVKQALALPDGSWQSAEFLAGLVGRHLGAVCPGLLSLDIVGLHPQKPLA